MYCKWYICIAIFREAETT